MDLDNGGGKRVFTRLGGGGGGHTQSSHMEPKTCFHWRAGRCNRNPCPYLHSELPQHSNSNVKRGYGNGLPDNNNNHNTNDRSFASQGFARRKPNNSNQQVNNKWGRGHRGSGAGGVGAFRPPPKVQDKICHFWIDDKCSYGDKCRYLHQWFTSDSFTMLTQLPGHEKVISAIAFPMGSGKLYSGSKDESVKVWDCQTGQVWNDFFLLSCILLPDI
ncbi:hypothetical protein AQUCO_00700980v1 [Aquilegia coerulea]|uniref:C3H1-type domain-containing protein n=1 Tax=Aquilegia coerulea TaxID=218851 RepID=A0A2G5EMQ5_AQUCA|nr:hypothetical protein AQUCO_00700980v1 [Aquilegia coerulea]